MNQVEPAPWPSGSSWAVCSLDRTAAELSSCFGLNFRTVVDGLGEVSQAAIWDDNAGQVLLEWREHPTIRSTMVEVDTSVSRDDALAALWRTLRLDIRSMDWINQYQKFPGFTGDNETTATELPRTIEGLAKLTDREAGVLELAAEGLTNREIGARLRLAQGTVAGHLQRIYLKLGIHGRSGLRAWADGGISPFRTT